MPTLGTMPTALPYLVTLARLVQLCRRPGTIRASARDLLRLLVSRARERSLVVTCGTAHGDDAGGLLVDGVAPDGEDPEEFADLVAQLRGHAIRRLEIRQHAPETELANLVRWLAREPGARGPGAAAARSALMALGLWHVEVTFVGEESLTEALDHDHRAGAPRQVIARYVAAAHAATEPRAVERALAGLDALVDAYAATGEACPVAAALVGLMTLRTGATWPETVRAAAMEPLAAIRERLGTPVVACLAAQRLAELPPAARAPLLAALRWLGAPGAGALVAQLLASEQLAVRRVYYDALVALRVGIPLLIQALGHTQWFIVRNAACLLGDMRAAEADAHLVALLGHAEPRVREAAAGALVQLGTPVAQAALARRLRDPDPMLRHYAARGAAAAVHPMPTADLPDETATAWLARQNCSADPTDAASCAVTPLAIALTHESDVEVQVAILHSLGRLGTPAAIQRLRLAVRPAPMRSSAFRVAALEALVAAQGHAARPVVEALCRDPDTEVQQAADALRRFTPLAPLDALPDGSAPGEAEPDAARELVPQS